MFNTGLRINNRKIVSDETFVHTESNYGGKVPEFLSESLCLGWQLVAVGVT